MTSGSTQVTLATLKVVNSIAREEGSSDDSWDDQHRI